jgi:hypothetical protein
VSLGGGAQQAHEGRAGDKRRADGLVHAESPRGRSEASVSMIYCD